MTRKDNFLDLRNDVIAGPPDEVAVPIVTCDPRKGLKPHQYFNPSCFSAPSQGHNGAFRLPYIHGPAYFNDGLGIFKDFKIGEAGKLQIRFQGFNFLNRKFDTYQQYGSSLYLGYSNVNVVLDNSATGGIASNLTDHRSLQLAAKYYF